MHSAQPLPERVEKFGIAADLSIDQSMTQAGMNRTAFSVACLVSAFDPLRTFVKLDKLLRVSVFTDLENAALSAIFEEVPELSVVLREQQKAASIVSRENDGGGFFTYLSVPDHVPAISDRRLNLGDNVFARVEGLTYGIGFLLIVQNGVMHVLDGHAIGVESTAHVDFANVGFTMSNTPFDT